jgi:nucleoside-diphosphate-sugar epimerase
MTVLVTGAAGFLGGHLTGLLADRGERPRALVRPGEATDDLTAAGADLYRADIGDRAALGPALRGARLVLHCAARTGPWGPEAEYQRVNVDGLATLVRAALDAGVQRIVHVSSITVHGNDVGGDADESSPLRAEPNPYSRSKLAGEQLLTHLIQAEGAPVTVVRPGWIYGPGDTASFGRIARMVQSGRMIMIGSGSNRLPLIYAGDAAQGILLAGESDRAAGRTYLLVNDEPVTQAAFLTAVAARLGVPAPHRRIPYRLAIGLGAVAEGLGKAAHRAQPPPVMRYGLQLLGGDNRFSIARARQELGFSPQVGLAEGVRRSVDWYLSCDPLTRAGAPA